MSDTTTFHPTEEELCNCALDECSEATREHIAQCTQCREFVEEIRTISHDIASIDDEPIPEQLNAIVLAITRGREKTHVFPLPMTWYIKPETLGMLAALVMFLMCLVYWMIVAA